MVHNSGNKSTDIGTRTRGHWQTKEPVCPKHTLLLNLSHWMLAKQPTQHSMHTPGTYLSCTTCVPKRVRDEATLKLQYGCGVFQPYCGISAGWKIRPLHHDGRLARLRPGKCNYLACHLSVVWPTHTVLHPKFGQLAGEVCQVLHEAQALGNKTWERLAMLPRGQAFKPSIRIHTHGFPVSANTTCEVRLEKD